MIWHQQYKKAAIYRLTWQNENCFGTIYGVGTVFFCQFERRPNMSEKRRNLKGRLLHNGEIQLADGRYRFKYVDFTGEERFLYSWRLEHNDPLPKGKKKCSSLRDMEKQAQADLFDHINSNGGDMTVLELVEKYVETRNSVRVTTGRGYKTVINFLKKEKFAYQRIDMVKLSDAKRWLVKLQPVDGKR